MKVAIPVWLWVVVYGVSHLCISHAAGDQPEDGKLIRVGIIGLDTSHALAFTRILNDPGGAEDVANCRVVAAYPQGSPDIESSVSRLPGYTRDIQGMGVRIVDSIEILVSQVDAVLLETNDGRPHLEQALPVIRARKPLFVDKPVAGSLADAVALYQVAAKYGTPLFSSSSLRYITGANEARQGAMGKVFGCDTFSPCSLEKTHPDLFWYGIHGVEALFTVMGTGCRTVTRTHAPGCDVVVGLWEGGRIGVYRGIRHGKADYGGTVYGESAIRTLGPYPGYRPLVVEIVRFFRTGVAPIPASETLEICAFMEAADESKRRGGQPVSIAEVMQSTQHEAQRRLAALGE